MYINKNIDYLKWLKNKKVIIFGAGVVGQKALYKLEKQGIEVVSFCDNDENKQKEVICGIRIISAYELIQINNNDIMIIICSNFEREIKLQLVSLNIYNFISVSEIDFGGGEEYYDEIYFSFQQPLGQFGGKVKSKIFQPYITKDMTVLEFGSGGGYLLNNIVAKKNVE